MPPVSPDKGDPLLVERQIAANTKDSNKAYAFNDSHDPSRPAQFWFQYSDEGEVLFIVFYTQACRWSRCLGCNLPSQMSSRHVPYGAIMAQIDYLFAHPDVVARKQTLRKIIISNNGSVLDEATFSSTSLIYLIAMINLHFPHITTLSLETRPEYVDMAELEFISRALHDVDQPTQLEVAIGFEVFDDRLRNEVFKKGLCLDIFESLCHKLAAYGFRLKCYFMLKPVPGMSDTEAVEDIHRAIDYLHAQAQQHGIQINMHLNPTYAASGTPLQDLLERGDFTPPSLGDLAAAALHAQGTALSLFLGLSDEGLACEGGSFIRPGDEPVVQALEQFNCTQDYGILADIAGER